MDDDRSGLDAVAALAEPTRRRLYDHVVRQPAPVGRDEVAAALEVSRASVAFHLDRLVHDGLLDVHYERRSGRTGPGAGRPSKLYRRSAAAVTVSLPARRYDLAGGLLAAAVVEAEASGQPTRTVLDRRAYLRGTELAASADPRSGGEDRRAAALRILEDHGYEPRPDGAEISLVNCPFHELAQEYPDLVCGMNLRMIDGVLDGLDDDAGSTELVARLDPTSGRCCVRLGAAAPTASS